MRKKSFKNEVAEKIAAALKSTGWQSSPYPEIFFKCIDENIWLVVTLINASKSMRGERLGQVYVPRVFLIHDSVEASYEQWCANSGWNPIFPKQAGTLWIAPNFFRLGCPKFFNEKFPIVRPYSDFYVLEDECKNGSVVAQFVLSDHDTYLFRELSASSAADKELYKRNPLVDTKIPERTLNHIEACIMHINGAATWLLDKADSYAGLLEFAASASNDIDTALLFGPVWPFRIPQLLLSGGRSDDAQKFREFLQEMKWDSLWGLNSKLATQQMNSLFEYYSLPNNRSTNMAKIDKEKYLEKYAEMVKRVSAKDSEHNARIQFEWVIFAGGLPGLFSEIDKSLYQLP